MTATNLFFGRGGCHIVWYEPKDLSNVDNVSLKATVLKVSLLGKRSTERQRQLTKVFLGIDISTPFHEQVASHIEEDKQRPSHCFAHTGEFLYILIHLIEASFSSIIMFGRRSSSSVMIPCSCDELSSSTIRLHVGEYETSVIVFTRSYKKTLLSIGLFF